MKKKLEYKQNNIVADAFKRLGELAYLLLKSGASLRLLSALLCMKSYASVYKLMIAHNPEIQRGKRKRPTRVEQERFTLWEQRNPELVSAMKEKDISPRRWCCLYNIFNDDDDVDIYALSDPLRYEYDKGIMLASLLKADFPSAYGVTQKTYWSAELHSDLFFNYEKTFSKGSARHIFSNDSLGIKVINRSEYLASIVFSKMLSKEVRIRRMSLLITTGLSEENIEQALTWLPPTITEPKTRIMENPGEGYKAMREAEERHRIEMQEKKRAKENSM